MSNLFPLESAATTVLIPPYITQFLLNVTLALSLLIVLPFSFPAQICPPRWVNNGNVISYAIEEVTQVVMG